MMGDGAGGTGDVDTGDADTGGDTGGDTGDRALLQAAALTRRKATGWKGVRWSEKMRTAFLDHLAATCHVGASAEVAGVSVTSVYALRRVDAAFASAWAAAVAQGYEMLELQLVGHALGGGGPALVNGAVEETGPIDVALALQLLTHHRQADGRPTGGPRLQRCARADTDASLLRKLNLMEARLRREGLLGGEDGGRVVEKHEGEGHEGGEA